METWNIKSILALSQEYYFINLIVITKKILLTLLFVISISLGLGYQDAAAVSVSVGTGNQDASAKEILVDDEAPDFNSNFICNFDDLPDSICASVFDLDSPATVTDLHFWILEGSGAGPFFNDEVTYTIYFNDVDVPGTPVPLGSATVPATKDTFSENFFCIPNGINPCHIVWVDIIPLDLDPGTYWVGVESAGLSFDATTGWTIFLDIGPSEDARSDDGGATWLLDGVPEFPIIITGPDFVGGEFLGVDSAALLLAGAQANALWLIPVVIAGIGFAIVIARKF